MSVTLQTGISLLTSKNSTLKIEYSQQVQFTDPIYLASLSFVYLTEPKTQDSLSKASAAKQLWVSTEPKTIGAYRRMHTSWFAVYGT